ncbi:MAG: hypothetical protein ABEJ24_05030 [Candidatus Magasanikbacteria bacterium]
MKNNIKIWRWVSVIPVAISSLLLPAVILLPLALMTSIIEAVFGVGPIGLILNSITEPILGLNSSYTTFVIDSGVLTGFIEIFVLSILIPKDNEKTSRILMYLLIFWFGLTLIILFIDNGSGEAILRTITLILGGTIGHYEIKESSLVEKHEKFVQDNIKKIFLTSLVISAVIFVVYFFFI